MRDYLQSNPLAAKEYGELKKRLALRFADDIDGYIDGKTPFILGILAASDFSSGEIEGIRGINRKPAERADRGKLV